MQVFGVRMLALGARNLMVLGFVICLPASRGRWWREARGR